MMDSNFKFLCKRLQDVKVGEDVSMYSHNKLYTYIVREHLEELGFI